MRGKLLLCNLLLTVIVGSATAMAQPQADRPRTLPMVLTSTAFADGAVIPDKYTTASASPVSPELSWKNVPAGTVTFALIMHDPEAVPDMSSADFLHWMVFNIPATVHTLPENMPHVAQLTDGTIQAKNRRGEPGYMGPGARTVYHHYTIELYALNTRLKLGPEATRAQLLAAMDGHVLGKGVLIGRFHR